MGVLDELNKIKQARRDEIAAAEEARRQAEEAARALFILRLNAAAEKILSDLALSWLAPLSTKAASIWDRDSRAQVNFEIPGHHAVGMSLRRIPGHDLEWRLATRSIEGTSSWIVTRPGGGETGYDLFADAVIAAEIEGWVPPAPVESEDGISPEAMHQVRTAWDAMVRPDEPMPVAYGLDMVQEETGGDRDDAVSALHLAAGEWLDQLRPEQAREDLDAGYFRNQFNASVACRGYLIGEEYIHADNCRLEIHNSCRAVQRTYDEETVEREDLGPDSVTTTAGEVSDASAWIAWCEYATTAIDLCRAVAAAAHPEPASAT